MGKDLNPIKIATDVASTALSSGGLNMIAGLTPQGMALNFGMSLLTGKDPMEALTGMVTGQGGLGMLGQLGTQVLSAVGGDTSKLLGFDQISDIAKGLGLELPEEIAGLYGIAADALSGEGLPGGQLGAKALQMLTQQAGLTQVLDLLNGGLNPSNILRSLPGAGITPPFNPSAIG